MGFLQRFMRLILGRTTEEDDEIERPTYPYTILHDRRNDDFERLPKSSIFHRLIGRVLQKVRFAFQLLRRPRKTANPSVLPIQDPSNNTDQSLQNVVISSPSNDSISSPETTPVSTVDGVYSDQQYYWPVENNSANNHVIISIPEYTHSFAYTSASEETGDSAVVLAEQNADKVDDQREEEKVIVQTSIVVHVDEEKWIKHYSSRHRILLVGDGDFSFSAALARAFGCASNMISTSLDSKEFLEKHYRNAVANIEELRNRSCKVMHGIDATKMANHALLGHITFDRIIYNFPHAGLILKELPREAQLKLHRTLVSQFLKNAKGMLSENGEIHISHKTNGFHREWNLEMVASSHRLRLIEAVDFNHRDYPGYSTKCGFGGDNYFNCYPSKTYKFRHI